MGAYLSWRVGRLAKRCFRPGNPEQQFTDSMAQGRTPKGGFSGKERDGDGSHRADMGASRNRLQAGPRAMADKYANRVSRNMTLLSRIMTLLRFIKNV